MQNKKPTTSWEWWTETEPTNGYSSQKTHLLIVRVHFILMKASLPWLPEIQSLKCLYFMASDVEGAVSTHGWMLPSHTSDVGSDRKQEVSALLGNSNRQWHCLVRAGRIRGIKITRFSSLLPADLFVLMLYLSGKGFSNAWSSLIHDQTQIKRFFPERKEQFNDCKLVNNNWF